RFKVLVGAVFVVQGGGAARLFCSLDGILRFFFSSRRRHTRWPRDWSSDVCSSDLIHEIDLVRCALASLAGTAHRIDSGGDDLSEIGRASCRERVLISGVGGSIKNKCSKIYKRD